MSHRKTLARLAVAPLMIVALTAPPALADTPYTDAERAANDRFNRDAAPAATLLKNSRDIAEAYRADAANQRAAVQDRRSENTVDASRADLPRTWPAYPRAATPAENPAPVADDGGDGDDWIVPVAIGGTLLLGAGLLAGSTRGRHVRPA
jgi:hypothetical protein